MLGVLTKTLGGIDYAAKRVMSDEALQSHDNSTEVLLMIGRSLDHNLDI